MKLSSAAMLALFAAAPAFASNVTIDFENVTGFQTVGDLYAGSGVTFTDDAQGLVNDGTGTGINNNFFTNAPSPIGVMTSFGPGAAMVGYQGARFYDYISFFYSSSEAIAHAVEVLDDLGNVLVSIDLTANANDGCNDTPFCNWTQVSANFSGAGRSVSFGATTYLAAFDNISTNVVPEPASVLLAGLALGAAFLTRRRVA